jgi:hypothetical protein
MVLDSESGPFDVEVSINCKSAEGVTEKLEIEPKELLKDMGENIRSS